MELTREELDLKLIDSVTNSRTTADSLISDDDMFWQNMQTLMSIDALEKSHVAEASRSSSATNQPANQQTSGADGTTTLSLNANAASSLVQQVNTAVLGVVRNLGWLKMIWTNYS
jgi:hypothetical protein